MDLRKPTLFDRIEHLGRISEESGALTRRFATPALGQAFAAVEAWMQAAGMHTRFDAIGNLVGRYEGLQPNAKTLLMGSHLDTVPNGGKYDGSLGILLALAAVEGLHEQKKHFPFAIEIVAFCDEEGVRYQSTYLGSRALAGTFPVADLERLDAQGISMADAIRSAGGNPDGIASAALNPSHYLGYLEAHIEQGPVLETHKLAVGVVTGIAGQSRLRITFTGQASHAGTTPMNLRKDALCAASEFVLETERSARFKPKLVATVGELRVPDSASNVVPGQVLLSLDLRHADNAVRHEALGKLFQKAQAIAAERRVSMTWEVVQESSAVKCSPAWIRLLSQAVTPHQHETLLLDSGAGHDAAALSPVLPVAMLFVRCHQGLSHHPDEYAAPQDIAVALTVFDDFLQLLASQPESLS